MKVLYTLAIAAGLALSACAGQGPHVPGGAIFPGVSGPTAVGSGMGGKRSGEACGSNILGIIAIGDNSITAAAKKGKLMINWKGRNDWSTHSRFINHLQ